jgi:propanol-preferring alcohol dehydrogenase
VISTAEYAVADARFCVPLPSDGGDAAGIAPLLDSGVTAYRALRLADAAVPKRPERLGLFGFGAGAHIVSQIAAWQGRRVFAFVREGDEATARYARSYGAAWAGPSSKPAPQQLDAALVFAADGALVPAALRAVRPGGVVVCVAIHMSDIPSFAYAALAGERVLRSVANITRRDVRELLAVAARARVRTTVRSFPLAAAEDALAALRDRRIQGAAVLTIDRDR